MRVTYRENGRERRARARSLKHVHQSDVLYIEVIPRDDPGGKREVRVDKSQFGSAEGRLTVYPHGDSSGKMTGSRLYVNRSGEWELMTDFGPRKVPAHWRSAR